MKNVLMLCERKDNELIEKMKESSFWNITLFFCPYHSLAKKLKTIKKIVSENNVDFLLYEKNEQMGNFKIAEITNSLNIGYSSFSGIDKDEFEKQTKRCLQDFISCNINLDISCEKIKKKSISGKTFSLIFDLEQLGGARYGLPRILKLLKKYEIPATFFTTNLIKTVYKNVLDVISSCGHEIGLHGLFHEYLSNYDLKKQTKKIKTMLNDFKKYKVSGSNFIGRMNEKTIEAVLKNNLKYFVFNVKNTKRFLSVYSDPLLIYFNKKNVWMVPVFAETYEKNWPEIKNQIDNTLRVAGKECHLTILMHPFYDGSKDNIRKLEKMIEYLHEKDMIPVRLDEKIKSMKTYNPEKLIKFHIERNDEKNKTLRMIKFVKNRLKINKIINCYWNLKKQGKRIALYFGG
jgi:peptidoglycan/xylan/chitin deacetylase (PgdA/CDA1 family)